MAFENFIWDKLPPYYEMNDNYKDADGKGLLQRYLSIFGLELDENITTAIDGLLDQLNPQTAIDQYLTEISYSIGSPDDILGDIDSYRNLLVQAISLYQTKGTFRSYKQLFNLLGMSVTIQELFPGPNTYDADPELVYDTEAVYDDDACSKTCIHYTLTYSPLPGTLLEMPLTNDKKAQLIAMIHNLIEPHSAELDSLIYQPL